MKEKISVETYHEAIEIVESRCQAKRDALKKKTTLYQGKFMIVKQENNKLRSLNTSLLKRINQLQEYMAKLEAQKYGRIINEGQLWQLPKLEKTVHEKEPIKC